ncbi:MAG: aromatic acid exporter family protein, partial [Lachnospiraceae bacterium]|nr:aromatic acid exporter family protein [Lachnospiraceae bacterium]
MTKKHWHQHFVKSMKIAVAAILAIALAGELGLQYSATAGIITVLSIQNTKRETFKSARNRGLAFLCALVLAAICYGILDFTLWAFAIYLFLFALLCLRAGWGEAIAMDSVLITHFLAEKSMSSEWILNEILLFVIGTGFGIVINIHLQKKGEEFDRLAAKVDTQIKEVLRTMSQHLLSEETKDYNLYFQSLQSALEEAKHCAATNYNNELWKADSFELDYIKMREQQSVVLLAISENLEKIAYLPRQARQVGQLFGKIEKEFHKENTVEGLLADLEE